MTDQKALYLSDLDGTLLRSNQKTSAFTDRVINELVRQGMKFSYATARSYHTASQATAGIRVEIPLIVYNGVFIVENITGKRLWSNFFTKEEGQDIKNALLEAGISPIVYCVEKGKEKFTYQEKGMNSASAAFIKTRKGDIRDTPVECAADLGRGEIFYFTCIDEERRLEPLYEKFRDRCACVYGKDIYSGRQWLEIMPDGATKARAALWLKEYLGCGKIVAFGDGKNDISLFQAAEECYAVENAAEELKQFATGIIGGNDADGVANFLYSL